MVLGQGNHAKEAIMLDKSGSFSFKVPEGHAEAGKKVEKKFDYAECENDGEAIDVMSSKKWVLVELVNDLLKQASRSNAYQNALAPYRPSEVSPEDIRERMIRDFIRLGVAENQARAQVESLLAANK